MLDDKSCILHAKLGTYRAKVERTIENITEMLNIVNAPYIAFSCGKDSSAMADMILSIDSTIPLRFISSGETRIMHNVDDVINYFKDKYFATVEEIHIDRVFSDEWKTATWNEQRKAGRRDIQTIDNSGYDGVFMGLRSKESRGRMLSLAMCHTKGLPRNMYMYKNRQLYRMCPLKDWTTADVGAYITEHEIPKLKWYEDHGYEGRTTARLTGDAVRQNTLTWIKLNNPEGYAQLTARFPELKLYQ